MSDEVTCTSVIPQRIENNIELCLILLHLECVERDFVLKVIEDLVDILFTEAVPSVLILPVDTRPRRKYRVLGNLADENLGVCRISSYCPTAY